MSTEVGELMASMPLAAGTTGRSAAFAAGCASGSTSAAAAAAGAGTGATGASVDLYGTAGCSAEPGVSDTFGAAASSFTIGLGLSAALSVSGKASTVPLVLSHGKVAAAAPRTIIMTTATTNQRTGNPRGACDGAT